MQINNCYGSIKVILNNVKRLAVAGHGNLTLPSYTEELRSAVQNRGITLGTVMSCRISNRIHSRGTGLAYTVTIFEINEKVAALTSFALTSKKCFFFVASKKTIIITIIICHADTEMNSRIR